MILAAEYLGHIQGGWEYVYASWGLTLAGMLFYGGSLYLRRRNKES